MIQHSYRDRLGSLDLLRFVAAMAVVLYHFALAGVPHGTGHDLSGVQAVALHGYLGVELFFVISGFVVLWSARGRSPAGFFRSRVLRLYPEFWISVLLSAAAFTLLGTEAGQGIDARVVAANLTMVPQLFGVRYVDDVYWTLGVELKFYALLWLLLTLGQIQRIEGWLFAWLVAAAAVFAIRPGAPWTSVVIHPFGPLFIAGGFFYLVHESGWRASRVVALLVCLGLASIQAVEQMPDFMHREFVTRATQGVTVLVIVAVFAAFSAIAGGWLQLGASRLLTALGAITYPLYLLHNIGKALFLRDATGTPDLASLVLAMLFALALAWGVAAVARRFVKPSLGSMLDVLPLVGTRAGPAAKLP